jgi:predicted N-acetyltransferase YhbS
MPATTLVTDTASWKGWLMVEVRSERAGDHDAIRRVNKLRGSGAWLPDLSLVAEEDGDVPGEVYPPAFDCV